MSFLKAGVFYATHLTTVSSTYAEEITHEESGCGLHGLLQRARRRGASFRHSQRHRRKLGPAPLRRAERPRRTLEAGSLEGRATRSYVRGAFDLAVSRGPLFAIVSRLVHQKGVDLAMEVSDDHRRARRPDRRDGPGRAAS